MATLNLQHTNHTGLTTEAVGSELRLHASATGSDAGDAVTVDATASGELSYDLSLARTIRSTVTGNVTSVAFTNMPAAGTWVHVITMDATGNYMISGFPVARWLGGRSIADLDVSANAVNILVYTYDGNELNVSLAWNGGLELDSFKLPISENGVYAVPIDAGEALDFANVQKPTGDAAVTFKKNGAGSDLTALTSFAAGDWMQVTVATLTTPTAVLIPRYVA